MIFIDSNIPMYLVGAAHPNRTRARELLERMIESREKLVTDVEVFQELLHRYVAIRRTEAIEPAWRLLEELTDEVLPVSFELVEAAKRLVHAHEGISARDALHAAVMQAHGIATILSFDAGFDTLESVSRIR